MSRFQSIEEEPYDTPPNQPGSISHFLKKKDKKNHLWKVAIASLLLILLGAIVALLVLFYAPNYGRTMEYYQNLYIAALDAEAIRAVCKIILSPYSPQTGNPVLCQPPSLGRHSWWLWNCCLYQVCLLSSPFLMVVRDKWLSYGINARIEEVSVLLTYPKHREVWQTQFLKLTILGFCRIYRWNCI